MKLLQILLPLTISVHMFSMQAPESRLLTPVEKNVATRELEAFIQDTPNWNFDLIKPFIDRGADPNIMVIEGTLPLLSRIIQQICEVEALKQENILRYLMMHGANLDAGDIPYRDTPLAYAVVSVPVTQFLLAHADTDPLNTLNRNGNPPLYYAEHYLAQGNSNTDLIIELMRMPRKA